MFFILVCKADGDTTIYEPPYDDCYWEPWKYTVGAAQATCSSDEEGYIGCYADAYVGTSTAYALQCINLDLDSPSKVEVNATIEYIPLALTLGPATFVGAEAVCIFDNKSSSIKYESINIIPPITEERILNIALTTLGLSGASQVAALIANVQTLIDLLQKLHEAKDIEFKESQFNFSFSADEGNCEIGVGLRVNASGGLLGYGLIFMVGRVKEIKITTKPENAVYVEVKNAQDVPDKDYLPGTGKSDPYVKVYIKDEWDWIKGKWKKREIGQTKTIEDTASPEWGDYPDGEGRIFFTTTDKDEFRLRLEIWDEDVPVLFDDYIGGAERKYTVAEIEEKKDEDFTEDDIDCNLYYSIRAEPAFNYPPVAVAKAGLDPNNLEEAVVVVQGDLVYFDGSGSYDLDDEIANYWWQLEQHTASGWNYLDSSGWKDWDGKGEWKHPAPGNPGVYIARLIVWDSSHPPNNNTDIVRIIVLGEELQPPVAEAGQNQYVAPGELVHFDGSGSSDPDDGIKKYKWVLGSGWSEPKDSGWLDWESEEEWSQGAWTHEAPSASGEYVATLTVKDHFDETGEDTMNIIVVPTVLWVDNFGDGDNGEPYIQGDGTNTLRKSIRLANKASGPNTIKFSISGPIYPESALPVITDDGTVIDASSQWIAGQPGITLDGSNSGAGEMWVNGLVISGADNCYIRGLFIKNFTIAIYIQHHFSDGACNNTIGGTEEGHRNVISGNSTGIQIGHIGGGSGTNNNIVKGNYIGTDINGTNALRNLYGISITGDSNIIGGITEDAKNIISGNAGGIAIYGSHNFIYGNYIGTDVNGTNALGNSEEGIHISAFLSGGHSNTIGGTTEGARNIISGNGTGVGISGGDNNTVCGNYIGTDISGTAALGNSSGVALRNGAESNTIAKNVISGNETGVEIQDSGTDNNVVKGNYIGTDASGTEIIGNSRDGVYIRAQSNMITSNIISANGRDGVRISGSNNTVSGNYIGTDKSGTQDLGNSQYGIYIQGGSSNSVGSPGNTIAFNLYGVVVTNANYNKISQNLMHDNWARVPNLLGGGIYLSNGNDDIPAPTIVLAVLNGNILYVKGTGAGAGATVEVFEADSSSLAVGYVEGKTYLGYLTADEEGNFSGLINIEGKGFSVGVPFTATTTYTNNNTSEFSTPAVEVQTPSGLIVNGDFSYNLLGWTIWERGPWGGPMVGEVSASVVNDDETFSDVLEIKRTGSDNSGAANGVYQDLNLDISKFSSLSLKFDVKVVNQSLSGSGVESTEYPVHIAIYYIDAIENMHGWHHGFYYNGISQDPDHSTRVSQGTWYSYTSPNLMTLNPKPRIIKRIKVFGNGWDYAGRIDNIQLTVQYYYGDVSQNDEITAYDAALILWYLVGLTSLSQSQLDAADVSGNGEVTAYDAALILQFVVELINEFPITSWIGAPSSGLMPHTISIPTLKARLGEKVRMPLVVDDPSEILAGELQIRFDSDMLRFIGTTSEFTLESNERNGILELAFASPYMQEQRIKKAVEIIWLDFEVGDDGKDYVELKLEKGRLNEDIEVKMRSGRIEIIPSSTSLLQNYPNPFNPETWIPFRLAKNGKVVIRIYDVAGRLIKTLDFGYVEAGSYTVKDRGAYWNGRNKLGEQVASGVYYYTLQTGDFSATRKMVILR